MNQIHQALRLPPTMYTLQCTTKDKKQRHFVFSDNILLFFIYAVETIQAFISFECR